MLLNFAKLVVLADNADLLCVSAVGGIVLFGVKLAAHFKRARAEKFSSRDYALSFASQLIALLGLALVMASVYILNGDKMSALLAFQVGISSPVIVQGLMVAGADQLRAREAQQESGP